MKKVFYFLTCFTLLFSFLIFGIQPGYAQAAAATPSSTTVALIKTPVPSATTTGSALAPADKKTFTFKELGYQEKLMVGPFFTSTIRYSIPENWQLVPGGLISLRFTMTVSDSGPNSTTPDRIHGTLLVMMNNKTVETIFLDKVGEYNITIPLTDPEALKPTGTNGEHELRLVLDSSISCNYGNLQTTLMVNPASSLTFEHQESSPMVDLSVFPRPIYQPNSIFATQVMMVIPDNPTSTDLKAAMNMVTGLGSQTEGKLILSVKPAKELTDADKKTNNLMFVGPLSAFSMLDSATYPVPVKDGNSCWVTGKKTTASFWRCSRPGIRPSSPCLSAVIRMFPC
jgi:hypothetical protein